MCAVKGAILAERSKQGLNLMFAAGKRPSATDVEHALAVPQPDGGATNVLVGHRPSVETGWLELLVNGLTFDLVGLVPAESSPIFAARHRFGLPVEDVDGVVEAIGLVDGPHIASGATLLPIIRAMIGLGSRLCASLPVTAVGWEPAGSWMGPDHFIRLAKNWLAGGAFPALGLTGVIEGPGGIIRSDGLAFFIGQEIEVLAELADSPAERVKLASRLIDFMVREGPLRSARSVDLPDGRGGKMVAESVGGGNLVRFRRGS